MASFPTGSADPLLVVAVVMIIAWMLGPTLAPKNLGPAQLGSLRGR